MRLQAKDGDYTSGVWQFEGDMYVPSGSTGVAVMQVMGGINGGSAAPTPFGPANVYNRWIHVNVIHDSDNKSIWTENSAWTPQTLALEAVLMNRTVRVREWSRGGGISRSGSVISFCVYKSL
ncbi:hypothetical protein SUGI_0595520 [Cryptomeria japonica]|nr:hypothetical protein SUGI_0595520 [Cryptomeria japonica]